MSMNAVDQKFNDDIEKLLLGKRRTKAEIEQDIKDTREKYKDVEISKVCCYGRVSTLHSEQEQSLFTQRTIFYNFINANKHKGYVLVEEIYDRRSATKADERPKFLNMIERAKKGEFNILLFKDSKRFSRNTEDFLVIIENLKRLGIYVVFISEGVNSKDADRMTLSMLGMLAESHSNGLHTSVTAAIRVNMERKEGRVPSHTFGYDKPTVRDSRVAYINEEEAELVREIFDRFNNNEEMGSIVADFRKRGIKTKSGNEFNTLGVRKILHNKRYIGVLEMHKITRDDVRSKSYKTKSDDWITQYREDLRIISDEVFYKAQEIFESRRVKDRAVIESARPVATRMFTSLIKCECCGGSLIRFSPEISVPDKYFKCARVLDKKRKADGIQCDNPTFFRESALKAVFGVYFTELLESREGIEELIRERVDCIIKEYKKNMKIDSKSDTELEVLREKYRRAKNLYMSLDLSESEFKEIKKELELKEKEARLSSIDDLSDLNADTLIDKFFGSIEELVHRGLELDKKEGYIFNSLFESMTATKNNELIIVFKGAKITNCLGISDRYQRHANHKESWIDLGRFINWQKVSERLSLIEKVKSTDGRINRDTSRNNLIGKKLFDKLYLSI